MRRLISVFNASKLWFLMQDQWVELNQFKSNATWAVVSALNKNHGNDVIHTGQQFFDRATCMRNRESTCIPMLQYNALRVAIPHPNGSAVGCHK